MQQSSLSFLTRGIHSSPQIWKKEKTVIDCDHWESDANLWVFENNIYDFKDFIDKHPGGPQWLQQTKGQNITEHFISYHLDQLKARSLLNKYFIKPVDQKNINFTMFTFDQNGLYRRTKKKLLEKYTKQELQNSTQSKKLAAVFLILWVWSVIMMSLLNSTVLAIQSGFLLVSLNGIAHNFVHKRNNLYKYIYLLMGFSPNEWEIMHCISHHSYANTLLDYEIQVFEPIIYYLRKLPPNNPWLWPLKQLIFLFTTPLNIIFKLFIVPLFHRRSPQWIYLCTLLEIGLIFIFNRDWYSSLKLFLIMQMAFSCFFTKLVFSNHRTQITCLTGNDASTIDFALHQVRSSSDVLSFFQSSFWSYLIFAGFNVHTVHHICPTIDNAHLKEADQILSQQTKLMNIKRNYVNGILQGFIQVQKHFFLRNKY